MPLFVTYLCIDSMFICMRTTLNLDDDLMRSIKQHAASTGRTLTSLLEESLRELLIRVESSGECYTLDWVPVEGGVQPGVDLIDRDALLDRMGEDR